eukprot:11347706-Alexandrium_andersonii.AAC.1
MSSEYVGQAVLVSDGGGGAVSGDVGGASVISTSAIDGPLRSRCSRATGWCCPYSAGTKGSPQWP